MNTTSDKHFDVAASPRQFNLVSLLLAVCMVQLIFVSIVFPLDQLFTHKALFYLDTPFHWYKIETSKALAAQGKIAGYDPYFGAGYFGGINLNAAMKLPALIGVLVAPWISTIVVYKVSTFMFAVLGPLCVPLGVRWLRFDSRTAVVASVLSTLLWWLSQLRWFHTAGMISYVFCAYLALPYSALVIRYLTEKTHWRVPVGLVFAGALGMFIHPEFPVPVVFLVIVLSITKWDDVIRDKIPMTFIFIPLLCLTPNLWWVAPMLHNTAFQAFYASQPYQKAVGFHIVWQEALGMNNDDVHGARLNIILWLGCAWVFISNRRRFNGRTASGLVIASAALIFFAAFGGAIPGIATMQPNRFSCAAYIYLCVPAAVGICSFMGDVWERRVNRGVAIVCIMSSFLVAAYFSRELVRELSPAAIPHYGATPPEVRGLGPNSRWILGWLKTATDPSARVLIQEEPIAAYDNADMAGYLALTADRELIGGPLPYLLFADFHFSTLIGKTLAEWAPEQVSQIFIRYNIGWVLAYTDEAKRLFDRVPELIPEESHEGIKTYKVLGAHSFFLEGSAKIVARGFDRIELDQVKGQTLTLKYHYVPGMYSVPATHIEPAPIAGDPIPFVRITDPPSHLVLHARQP